jgi:hypothetical protein
MSLWDKLSATMDAAVDTVGDDILFATTPTGAYRTIKGFVIPVGASQADVDFIDEAIDQKPRVKINKTLLAAKPGLDCRVRHARAGRGHVPSARRRGRS